jgi:hypothetical protein
VSFRRENRFDDDLARRGAPSSRRGKRIEHLICIHTQLQGYCDRRSSSRKRMIRDKQRGGSPSGPDAVGGNSEAG